MQISNITGILQSVVPFLSGEPFPKKNPGSGPECYSEFHKRKLRNETIQLLLLHYSGNAERLRYVAHVTSRSVYNTHIVFG